MTFSEVSRLLQALGCAGFTDTLARRLISDSSLAQEVVKLVQRGHAQVDWSEIRHIKLSSEWQEVAPGIEMRNSSGESSTAYRIETPTGLTKARHLEPTDDWQDIQPDAVQVRHLPTHTGCVEVRHKLC